MALSVRYYPSWNESFFHECSSYYENAQRVNHRVLTSNGFGCGWDLEDLLRFGRRNHACPFYASKQLREEAEIIFCPYNYLIDPFIRSQMEINLNGHIVILDEAHNMEDTARWLNEFAIVSALEP